LLFFDPSSFNRGIFIVIGLLVLSVGRLFDDSHLFLQCRHFLAEVLKLFSEKEILSRQPVGFTRENFLFFVFKSARALCRPSGSTARRQLPA